MQQQQRDKSLESSTICVAKCLLLLHSEADSHLLSFRSSLKTFNGGAPDDDAGKRENRLCILLFFFQHDLSDRSQWSGGDQVEIVAYRASAISLEINESDDNDNLHRLVCVS
jgi:hypothetical protein